MRKRYVLTGAAALALMATSAVALGDNLNGDEQPPSEAQSANYTVTLPSGDTVTLTPEGRVHIDANDDRDVTSFLSPPALDGSDDVMVIPSDRAADIASGDENPALYNVSALLRGGHSDARDVDSSTLEDTTYGQFVPASESLASNE